MQSFVVSTAYFLIRRAGVHSAMSLRKVSTPRISSLRPLCANSYSQDQFSNFHDFLEVRLFVGQYKVVIWIALGNFLPVAGWLQTDFACGDGKQVNYTVAITKKGNPA